MKIKKFIKKTVIKSVMLGIAAVGVGASIHIVVGTKSFIDNLGNISKEVLADYQAETGSVNVYTPESGYVGSVHIGASGRPILSVENSDNNVVASPKLDSTEETEASSTEETEATHYYISLTEDEQYQLATLIWLEGRGEPIEGQKAIASVVINRYTTSKYTGNDYSSILDVIYETNQFSPAHLIDESEPSQVQLDVVTDIMINGPSIPEYVTFFRAYHYHNWNCQMQYALIGQTYFSYDLRLFEKWSADHPGYEDVIHVPTN